MHRKTTPVFILFLSLLLLFSCEKWNLDKTNFLELEITDRDTLTLDSLRLTALIRNLEVGEVQGHGFVWSSRTTEPTFFFNDDRSEQGVIRPADDQSFQYDLKLKPLTRYFIRAYASANEGDFFFSDTISYYTGSGEVKTLSLSYLGGFELNLTGQLSGLRNGLKPVKYGFCWSETDPDPALGNNCIDVKPRDRDPDDGLFEYTYTDLDDDLQNNTIPRYFRAFAILSLDLKQDTVFGQTLTFDGQLNVWVRIPDDPDCMSIPPGTRTNAIGFSIGEKAYFGLGQAGFIYKSDFWEFDFGSGCWTQLAAFPGGPRANAVGFAIGDKGYVGLGQMEDVYQKDFWKYDPELDSWTPIADFASDGSGPGKERTKAAGFTVGRRGFVGLGEEAPDVLKTDFWVYDTLTKVWTPIAAAFPGEARADAVSFSIEEKGFVGLGRGGSADLKTDFWEYDTLAKAWTPRIDFPGGARDGAVAFPIGSKGFVGLGQGEAGAIQPDFWEFDPQAGSAPWRRVSIFTGAGRTGAVGLSIDEGAMIGFGQDRNGNTLADAFVWFFTP